jgi:DNA primase
MRKVDWKKKKYPLWKRYFEFYFDTRTINQINERYLSEIIEQYVELKKKGANKYEGKSPWVPDEKTPSFHVNDTKNGGMWKCFSTGRGGKYAAQFVMEHLGMNFPEAVKDICQKLGITCEEEQETKEQAERRKKQQSAKDLNRAAQKYFIGNRHTLPDDHAAQSQLSRFDDDSITTWGIGYATGNQIYPLAKEKALVKDCEAAGLLRNKEGNYHDYFYNRLTFPIHNQQGEIIGFAARALADEKPKYLNSPETPAFKKDQILYGLHHARDTIYNTGRAILTEGYTDVIAMHEGGFTETVATMGTALSEHHVKNLKRLCNHVILLRDGDAAGNNAMQNDLVMLLQEGFKVELVQLPDGKDPYDILHDLEIEDPVKWINENLQDAVLHVCQTEYDESDPYKKADSIDNIAAMLRNIKDPVVRDSYREIIRKELKLKAKDLKEKEEAREAQEKSRQKIVIHSDDFRFPEGIDPNDAIRDGFYFILDTADKDYMTNKTGYYFSAGDSKYVKMSNFIFEPLFHKPDQDDNARYLTLKNGIDEPEIVELPSKAMITVDQFKTFMFEKGAYFFDGAKPQLDRLNKKYLRHFPKAWELKTLGWQKEGFFAFFNCIYNGKLSAYDIAGLVEHDSRKYFSPAVSDLYKDVRQDDDLFENDRYLKYEESPITFKEWMGLMFDVYGQHAFAGIPFVFVAIFRDIVFKVDNNCPFLYCYGETQSGKSKFGESIAAVFFKEIPAFSLNQGTDFAFANRFERYRNCPVLFNEFDDNDIKHEWFQALKSAFDGEGRERGKGKRNKTEIQRVNSAIILMGQYLSTKDDNSVVNRSIPLSFVPNAHRTEDQIKKYDKLKQLEKQGITSLITELLPYRAELEKEYYTLFNDTFKELRTLLRAFKQEYKERVMRNYCALGTMVKFFSNKLALPFEWEEYKAWMHREIVDISAMISESDLLSDFWNTVQLLFEKGLISEGNHFKVENRHELRLTGDDKKDYKKDLGKATNILYLRLKELQKEYAVQVRKEGRTALPLSTLRSYMKNRDYYLGYVNSESISGRKFSCEAFDYEGLGINLEKKSSEGYPPPAAPMPEGDLPF